MNYQIEIDNYRRLYEAVEIGNQPEKDRLARIIDNLMLCKSMNRADGVIERFIPDFSYASKFPKPDFKPSPHKPRFCQEEWNPTDRINPVIKDGWSGYK